MEDQARSPGSAKAIWDALAAEWESLQKALKFAGTLCTACGFVYLLTYARSEGMPFPLELSVLPATLVVLGVISVFGTILLVAGILVPALMADDPLGVTREFFLALDSIQTLARGRVRIRRYLAWSWLPMVASLLGLLFWLGIVGNSQGDWPVAAVPVILATFWIVVTPMLCDRLAGKGPQYVVTMLIQTVCSVFGYCFAVLLFAALYPKINEWDALWACVAVLAAFSLIHAAITLPHDSGKAIQLPPHFKHPVAPASAAAFAVAIAATIISVLIYPINSMIGRVALRGLGIGGGLPITLCLKDKPPEEVTRRITFSADHCSESAALLFDGGDKIYVTRSRTRKEETTDANGKKGEKVVEPIYFRQDEVREKIYYDVSTTKPGRTVPVDSAPTAKPPHSS